MTVSAHQICRSIAMQQTSSSAGVVSGICHHVRDGIMVIELIGRAGPQLLKDHVREYLDVWASHNRMLYDLRKFDVGSVTPEGFLSLGDDFAPVHERRGHGRAALLIPEHLRELARILIALFETQKLPLDMNYFFDMASAEAWLLDGDSLESPRGVLRHQTDGEC